MQTTIYLTLFRYNFVCEAYRGLNLSDFINHYKPAVPDNRHKLSLDTFIPIYRGQRFEI